MSFAPCANVVVAPPSAGSDAALADAAIMDRIVGHALRRLSLRRLSLHCANTGTHPSSWRALGSTKFPKNEFLVEGGWRMGHFPRRPIARMVGQAAARQFGLAPGSQIDLRAGERNVSLTVSGIITSGR